MKRLLASASIIMGIVGITIATTLPAYAVNNFKEDGVGFTQNYACNHGHTYGAVIGEMFSGENNCNVRVWVFGNDGHGNWSFCVNPKSFKTNPPGKNFPFSIFISNNFSNC